MNWHRAKNPISALSCLNGKKKNHFWTSSSPEVRNVYFNERETIALTAQTTPKARLSKESFAFSSGIPISLAHSLDLVPSHYHQFRSTLFYRQPIKFYIKPFNPRGLPKAILFRVYHLKKSNELFGQSNPPPFDARWTKTIHVLYYPKICGMDKV